MEKSLLSKSKKTSLKESDRLRKEIKELKELISIVFHNLKNPLNSIIGFIDLSIRRHDTLSEDKKKEFLNLVSSSSKNLFTLFQDMENMYKTLQDKNIQSCSIKVGPEIDSVISLMAINAQGKGIKIINKVAADFYVLGDATTLRSVLQNLIFNAIKFSPPNGKIEIYSKKLKNKGKITVKDSGVGMKPETLKQIFVGSVQSTPGTNKEEGSGLGLWICQIGINKMKGRIWATSKPGSGSKFNFVLPLP